MKYLKKIDRGFLIFTLSRSTALFFKPFFIWILMKKGMDEVSINVSIYFLVTSSVMVLFNNEANVEFYRKKFDLTVPKYQIAKAEYRYYMNSIMHIQFFLLVAFVVTVFISGLGFGISFILLVLLVLEKVIDEIQRDLQFEKKFIEWSKITLLKLGAPIVIMSLVALMNGTYFFFEIYLGLVFIFMVFILLYYLERRVAKKVIYLITKKKSLILWVNYLKDYIRIFLLRQIQAFSSKNIVLADRLIIKFVNIDLLPQATILGQIASISILFVDYFMISNRRKEYVVKRKILQIVSLKKIMQTFMIAFLLSSFAMVFYTLNGQEGLLVVGIITVVYYSIFALSQHFSQFNFWNKSRLSLLAIDVLFFVLLLVVKAPLFYPFDYAKLVLYFCAVHLIRLVFHILLATNSKNEASTP